MEHGRDYGQDQMKRVALVLLVMDGVVVSVSSSALAGGDKLGGPTGRAR